MGTNTAADVLKEIDEEIVKIQTELISENDFQKLQNKFDNNFVNANSNVEGIAENLATYYMLYGDINLINTEIELLHSITREEIRDVAKKYLNPNQRLLLDYIPSTEQAKN
jgi:predicted Zn-dependent peptidase